MFDPASGDPLSPPVRESDAVPPPLSWRYLVQRLFFTKRNEMDLGYAFLIPFLLLFYVAWIFAALRWWAVTAQMWISLVAIITSMLVATVPVWRARIMRDRDYGYGGFGAAGGAADLDGLTTFSTAPTAEAR